MKDICDVVQDILPLYLDGDLRVGTKRFVDDHLKECASCRQSLADSVEGEQLFREVVKENNIDAVSGRRIWFKSMLRYLLKPAVWVFMVLVVSVTIIVTMVSRPNMVHYEILTTAATAEEMLHPGFFRAGLNRDGNNALKFMLEQFSSPYEKDRYTYIYRANWVNESIILDRLYPSIDASAELYYPDVKTPEPKMMPRDILMELDNPMQFSLSFNRFVSLAELKLLFEDSDVELLWLGIATRDYQNEPNWQSFNDLWGLPVHYLQNNIKEFEIAVQEEIRNRTKMLTDYQQYLTGVDSFLPLRLKYIQKNGIKVFGVVVRATGPDILRWIDKYPLVRYYRRMS